MTISPGKLYGLQRLADEQGVFCITAMDQRSSLRAILAPDAPSSVPDEDLVDAKIDLAAALSPGSTAVLLDPQYGVPHAMAAGALSPSCGLLVTLERDGWEEVDGGRVAGLPDGWGVEKIRRLGADGVKLLVRYRPDVPEAASRNRALVEQVAEDCRRFDIPLVVESLSHALPGQSDADYAREKPDLVIETARQLSQLGIDLFKAEFPGDVDDGDDVEQLDRCRRLDEASQVPWVVLSAGVGIAKFARMVRLACQAGASGFLAGRAIWKDEIAIPDRMDREDALLTRAAAKLAEVSAIARALARPWTDHPSVSLPDVVSFTTDWYTSY